MKHYFKIENIIKKEVYLHLLFWICYISLPLLKYTGNDYFYTQWILNNSNIFLVMLTAYCCYYFNYPLKSKYRLLLLGLFLGIMTLFGVYLSKFIIDLYIDQLGNYSVKAHAFSILSEYILICLIFYSFYSFKKRYALHNSLRIAELKNLKTQINPHFLFNTLNSIYSYTLQNDKKASELILKLSDNFKYVLNEGKKEKVPVKTDWQHCKDFIAISTLRWEEKIIFDLKEEIHNESAFISPLIFITFIENAVKYTSKLKGENKIKIDLKVTEDQVSFQCSNIYDSNYMLSHKWESGGIGLTNTKKRLELLYPNKHDLIIQDDGTVFKVDLNILLC